MFFGKTNVRFYALKVSGGTERFFGERSNVTKMLWDIRNREDVKLNPEELSKEVGAEILTRTPADSYVEIILPFTKDEKLQQQYISPFGHVRIGRLLEDLDAIAGNVAFLHCDDGNAATRLPQIVTAAVDKLDLLPKAIDPLQDLKLTGCVCAVGKSSMEIQIDAYQLHGETWDIVLTTYFTMVARDPYTGKAHVINKLESITEKDEERRIEGEKNKQERLNAKANSLHLRLPTQEELQLIHNWFVHETSDDQTVFSNSVPMLESEQKSLIFCGHQQRNIHNKIFGGYLMRKAFELAFSTAYLFAGKFPYFSALGDITFNAAVDIGAILDLQSKVVYTEKNSIQVHVVAAVHDPQGRKKTKTNEFDFTFELYDKLLQPDTCMKSVRPETYKEAMQYVDGKRRLLRHRKHVSRKN